MKLAKLRPIMYSICLLAVLSTPVITSAETVSIMVYGNGNERLLLEAAMKRHLRAEGYSVKGGTTDGYLLVIDVMPSMSVGGAKRAFSAMLWFHL